MAKHNVIVPPSHFVRVSVDCPTCHKHIELGSLFYVKRKGMKFDEKGCIKCSKCGTIIPLNEGTLSFNSARD